MTIEWGKLIVLLTIVVGAFIVFDDASAFALVSAVAGYCMGNGRLASRREDGPVPLLGRKKPAPPPDAK